MAIKTKSTESYNRSGLNTYLCNIRMVRRLTFEEEKMLSEKILRGDEKAKKYLIRSNLRLVVKIALGYYNRNIDLLDIIQEGNIGLIRAAEKYDYRKNVKFSTYASFWIRQCIVRALNNKRRMIRLPQRKEEKLKKITKVIQRYSKNYGRYPDISELSFETNMREDEIKKFLNFSNNVISIESSNGDEDVSVKNTIEDSKYNPVSIFMRNHFREKTEEMLKILTEKEKKILLLRYSFLSGRKYTLKDVGKRLSISPETVRQIEKRALQKIRVHFTDLKEFIYD